MGGLEELQNDIILMIVAGIEVWQREKDETLK